MFKPILSPKKKKEEPAKEEEEQVTPLFLDLSQAMNSAKEPKIRVTGVYGDINEEKCSETLFSLIMLAETAVEIIPGEKPEDDKEVVLPMDFYISTHGGSATEMFGLYDMMRKIRDFCPIHTFGLGKVMSAGVLLLAAGTKGERRIGANCRVMIHGVVSGQQGYLADVENEFEEAKFTQELYCKALASETNMSLKYIKKLLQRKTNVYLSAKEAVELGIADIII